MGASGVVEKHRLEGETGAGHRVLVANRQPPPDRRRRFGNPLPRMEPSTGKLIRTIPSTANPLAFSPDDRLALAQSGEGKDLALMDVSTGKTVRRFAGADTGVFWPSGGWVLTGNDDMSLRLWNLSSGKEVRRIQCSAPARPKDPQSGEVVQDHHFDRIQLSPSGRLVVTVDIGRNNVFDTATTKLVCELETPKEQPGLLDLFAPSSAEERQADSDRFNDGTFWHRLEAVAFTADEQWIVGKEEMPGRRIVIWNAKSGKIARVIIPPVSGEIELSPDGRFILQSGKDDISYLWDFATGDLLCRLVLLDDDHWAVIDPVGRFDASNGGDVTGLHWVVRNEPIDLAQLKERYYEPGLLAKKLGLSKEPLRNVQAFNNPKLAPEVSVQQPKSGDMKFEIELANRGGGIGRIVVLINGKRYDLPDAARGSKPNFNAGKVTVPIDLAGDPRLVPGGKNRIEIQAFNVEGYLPAADWKLKSTIRARPIPIPRVFGHSLPGPRTTKAARSTLRFPPRTPLILRAACKRLLAGCLARKMCISRCSLPLDRSSSHNPTQCIVQRAPIWSKPWKG